MPESTKLQAQTTAEDSALVETGINNSIFRKRPHHAVSDFAFQEKKAEYAAAIVNSGQEFSFEFDKEGTILDEISLHFTAPSLTGLIGGAPTFARYGDFGALQCLSSSDPIRFTYGSTKVNEVHPDEIFVRYNFLTNEQKVYMEDLMLGELTPAQRNTLALGTQEMVVPIPTAWDGDGNQLPICALANKLKVTFRFAPAAQAIQTDGVKPLTIPYTNVYLRYRLGHVTGSERAQIAAPTFTEEGVFTLFSDVTKKDDPVNANSLNTANALGLGIDLTDFTGPIRHICGLIREASAMDISQPSPAFYDINPTYLNTLTFQVRANDKTLFEPTRPNFEQTEQLKKLYDCTPDIQQFYAWWDVDPTSLFCASGHISLANFTNPRIYLRSTANHPALIVTQLAFRWNWTNMMNGVYTSIWK